MTYQWTPWRLNPEMIPTAPYIECVELPLTTPYIQSVGLPPTSPVYGQTNLPMESWTLRQPSPSSSISRSPSPTPQTRTSLNHILAKMPLDITRDSYPSSHLIPPELCEPATNPPVKSLRLKSELPWLITVETTIRPYVTIHDVQQTLFRNLHFKLRSNECQNLQIPAEVIHENCCQRLGRRVNPDPNRWCRIDILGGKRTARAVGFDEKGCIIGVEFGY